MEQFTEARVTFYHPIIFWLGLTSVVIGTGMHIPIFLDAASMNYMMANMPMTKTMLAGMALIIAGTIATAYGLYPRKIVAGRMSTADAVSYTIHAMDDAPLSREHWKLLLALTFALIIDVMKPATLGFVMPGMAIEYGLSKHEVAILPFFALIGTAVGSVVWGLLGDAIGRRASLLLAAVMFIGTSICGAMPTFAWNVFMCIMMGLSAGGLLPVTFTLLAETIPRKQRGGLSVLIGGIGAVGGYIAASGFAALLEPHFGWRVMWFLGLPTGLIVIALNRYIPESPRFLAQCGRVTEAMHVLQRFGASVTAREAAYSHNTQAHVLFVKSDITRLFKPPFTVLTFGLTGAGLAWGLVNFGFLLWLPANLQTLGLSTTASDTLLAQSALFAFPPVIFVAWMYHVWGTKRTLALFAGLLAITLLLFSTFSNAGLSEKWLPPLVTALLISSSGLIAMLFPYAAEVVPNGLRGTGSGLIAGSSKAGGVLALSVAMTSALPGIALSALIVAIPTALSALLVQLHGIETRNMRLEDIELEMRAKKKDVSDPVN